MCGKIYISFVSLLLLSSLVIAQEWWETKPYMQWTTAEVDEVLNDSPWVSLSPAGVRTIEIGASISTDRSSLFDIQRGGARQIPLFYRVRLITARPVRKALLRRVALGEWVETTVNVEDYQTSTVTEREQAILDKFIEQSPDDIRVKGDEEHIIVALTLRVGSQDMRIRNSFIRDQNWIEQPNGDELYRIDASTLYADTSLTTKTKEVALVRYEPPGPEGLGAKYYFPRKLSNGVPFIGADDKELLFETRINESTVKVKFDLRKMLYNGKLEI